jgi:mannose-6-phosphate isomerase-like protein (cupin superfamily)
MARRRGRCISPAACTRDEEANAMTRTRGTHGLLALVIVGLAATARAGGGAAGAGVDEAARAAPGPYQANIVALARDNTAYRKVLFTGARSQLVVMSIPPGSDIGSERHERVEQTLFILAGTGRATLDGVELPVAAGDVLVITPGTEHDVVNTGADPLQIYTIYAPPNHIDGRIHQTKADAERDVADQRFSEQVE